MRKDVVQTKKQSHQARTHSPSSALGFFITEAVTSSTRFHGNLHSHQQY